MSAARHRITWKGDQVNADATKAMAAGLREAGKYGRKTIRGWIGTSAGSPEGGPPGSVSGNLRKAVGYKVRVRRNKYIVANIGVLSKSPYDSKAPGKSFPGRMHAQAARLAAGYKGTDRLGRKYSQRGRPFADLTSDGPVLAQKVKAGAAAYMPKAKKR